MNTIVFDLETVPDMAVWYNYQAPPPDPGPDAPPKRGRKPKAKAEPFAPLHAHRVIAIGYVLIEGDTPKGIGCAYAQEESNESTMLRGFGAWLDNLKADIVTWNGRGFDCPVLQLRSYRHGIPQNWYRDAHRRRYDEGAHVDLCDVMSNYSGRIDGVNLDTFAKLIGLPGKGEVNGAGVSALYQAGEHAKIQAYCKRDVVQTAYVYLRYRLLRGMPIETYRAACAELRALWAPDSAFDGFTVDTARLELP